MESDFSHTTTPHRPHSRGRCLGWLAGGRLGKRHGMFDKSWFKRAPSAAGGASHVRNLFQCCTLLAADGASSSSSSFRTGRCGMQHIAWDVGKFDSQEGGGDGLPFGQVC